MRTIRRTVALGVLTAAASVIGSASAATHATSVKCSWRAHIEGGIYHYRGAVVGTVTCSHPFGAGGYRERYQDNLLPPTAASETGSSKLSLAAGVVRGTYELSRATAAGTARYQGTLHVTGGSGNFVHVRGTLHMSCAHIVPPTDNCTASGTVTGL
jgi:hypothetical protein